MGASAFLLVRANAVSQILSLIFYFYMNSRAARFSHLTNIELIWDALVVDVCAADSVVSAAMRDGRLASAASTATRFARDTAMNLPSYSATKRKK
jgi:hypothetical protein